MAAKYSEELKERAREMRANDVPLALIAQRLGVASHVTVARWTSRVTHERDRAYSRNWKARNAERRATYGREYAERTKSLCVNRVCREWVCRNYERCLACREAEAEVRRTLAEGMWADGWSLREMAAAFGVTTGYFGVRRWRDGWDMPYRYRRRSAA